MHVCNEPQFNQTTPGKIYPCLRAFIYFIFFLSCFFLVGASTFSSKILIRLAISTQAGSLSSLSQKLLVSTHLKAGTWRKASWVDTRIHTSKYASCNCKYFWGLELNPGKRKNALGRKMHVIKHKSQFLPLLLTLSRRKKRVLHAPKVSIICHRMAQKIV